MPNAAESSCHSTLKMSKEWCGRGWSSLCWILMVGQRHKQHECLKYNKTSVYAYLQSNQLSLEDRGAASLHLWVALVPTCSYRVVCWRVPHLGSQLYCWETSTLGRWEELRYKLITTWLWGGHGEGMMMNFCRACYCMSMGFIVQLLHVINLWLPWQYGGCWVFHSLLYLYFLPQKFLSSLNMNYSSQFVIFIHTVFLTVIS